MQEFSLFYPAGHEAHREYGHPERPERVEAIRKALLEAGWWDVFPHLDPVMPPDEVMQSVHSPEYLAYLQAACQRGQHLDADTYTTPASFELAIRSAGGAIAVAQSVWNGQSRSGFALTRPPGHHAAKNQGMGFCLINNIAVAAEYLLQKEKAQRLAIVDLDLHHGNGTQEIFWQRGEVLYISVHQSPLYPGTGMLEERGSGDGFGTNANIPLPPMSGDLAFQASMEQLIIPLLNRYLPQMILVSTGFDVHWKDPLGNLLLSAGAHGQLIAQLRQWADQHCDGKICLFLEGGYDLEAGAACALSAVAALTDQSWEDPIGPSPEPEGAAWRYVINKARTLWDL